MRIPTTSRYSDTTPTHSGTYPNGYPSVNSASSSGYQQLLPLPGEWRTVVPESSLLWNAVQQLSFNEQVEPEMPLAIILAATAIAAQGLYDVHLPNHKTRPLSLNIKVVAASNERKSTSYNHVMSIIHEVEANYQRQYVKLAADYDAEIKVLNAEEKAILKAIEKATKQGQSTAALNIKLKEHREVEPEPPRLFQLLYQDVTPEAYLEGLSSNLPSGGIITDEGHDTYKGALMRRMGLLNNLSDGEWVRTSRVSRETTRLAPSQGVRSSALWLTQPAPLEEFLERHGEMARATGTLGRWIICAPRPRQGSRLLQHDPQYDWSHWEALKARIKDLVKANRVLTLLPDSPRECLQFSEAAARDWVQLHNECEQQCQPGGRFEHCLDHGGKLPEIMGRVAGLLHLIEGGEGDIQRETVLMAADIVCAFSDHFQRVFLPPPQPIQDAEQLDQWLNQLRNQNLQVVRHNFVRQCGPNRLRQKHRLEAALEILIAQNRIMPLYHGRTRYLNLKPHLQIFLPGGTH